MTDAPKLLPCPFCKSPAEYIITEDEDQRNDYDTVRCTACPAEMRAILHWMDKGGERRAELEAAWNTRPAPTPSDDISRAAVLAILKTMPPGKEMQKQFGRLTRKVEALPRVEVAGGEQFYMWAASEAVQDAGYWSVQPPAGGGNPTTRLVTLLPAALAQISATPAARGEDPRTHEKPHSSPA